MAWLASKKNGMEYDGMPELRPRGGGIDQAQRQPYAQRTKDHTAHRLPDQHPLRAPIAPQPPRERHGADSVPPPVDQGRLQRLAKIVAQRIGHKNRAVEEKQQTNRPAEQIDQIAGQPFGMEQIRKPPPPPPAPAAPQPPCPPPPPRHSPTPSASRTPAPAASPPVSGSQAPQWRKLLPDRTATPPTSAGQTRHNASGSATAPHPQSPPATPPKQSPPLSDPDRVRRSAQGPAPHWPAPPRWWPPSRAWHRRGSAKSRRRSCPPSGTAATGSRSAGNALSDHGFAPLPPAG